jgi:hypothetical protein
MKTLMLMPDTVEDVAEVVSTLHKLSDGILCGCAQQDIEFDCMGVVIEDARLIAYATKYGTTYSNGRPTSAEVLVHYELL